MDEDARACATAAGAHGVVTVDDLHRAGLSTGQVQHRLAVGLLVPLHRGVYRHAAAPPTRMTALLGAVRACGAGAVASHRSAAWLWELRDVPRWRPEVTVPHQDLPRHHGITRHRTDTLDPVDVAVVHGVPTTSVARTLLDLGAVLPAAVVEVSTHDAVIRGLVGEAELVSTLERLGRRGRRGTAALRAAVVGALPPAEVESRLEASLLRLVRGCPVPEPELQWSCALGDGRQVRLDLAWPALGIAVEADGRRWHSTRADFERDLVRTRAITAAGWIHLRYGWTDVHDRADAVRAEVTAALTGASGRPAVVAS
jgi:hypothetical protein